MPEESNASASAEGARPAAASPLGTIALVLTILGGLNWAMVGLLELDGIAMLFGAMTVATRVVYGLIGLAAAYTLFLLPGLIRAS